MIVEPEQVKGKQSKEDKAKAKMAKEEAKKAEKERKAKEKEDKKRLKKEKEEAKKQKEKERKEQRRKGKDKKNKGKEAVVPPPDLPAGADFSAAAIDSHPQPHPGCQICEHPQEQDTLDFMSESLRNWQGLPSFQELTEAAKKLIGMKNTNEAHSAEANATGAKENPSPEDQKLVEHIARHIDSHIHNFLDPKSSGGGSPTADKVSPHDFAPNPAPSGGPAAPGKQQKGENGSPTSHRLDGNRDWPMTVVQSQILHGLGPAFDPDFAASQPPSRTYSPVRASSRAPSRVPSRCVSPWCEHLGFKVEDPRPAFPKRAASWSRRGYVT